MNDEDLKALERRLGRLHAKQRLGVETDHEAQLFGQGLNFVHFENSPLFAVMVEVGLKATGLYWRGRRNAEKLRVAHNRVDMPDLPQAFDGYTILQLSDLHADMNEAVMRRMAESAAALDYDICVVTGDIRGKTAGDYGACLDGVAALRPALVKPVYAVLGNHDTIRMVPRLERMGIRVLLNETETIERGGARIHLTGIDDAHYFRADNMEKALAGVPEEEFSILLSHTPEIYLQAAHADFNLLLSGHTHGGQICLPGGIPLTLDSNLPRRLGAGAWVHRRMHGYTSVGAGSSVVPVRFNCPPEITLHHLHRAEQAQTKEGAEQAQTEARAEQAQTEDRAG